MNTPGERRAHARYLHSLAAEKRRMAANPDATAHWRKHWLADADRLDEDADWFEASAGRGEISTEYTIIIERMAAE